MQWAKHGQKGSPKSNLGLAQPPVLLGLIFINPHLTAYYLSVSILTINYT